MTPYLATTVVGIVTLAATCPNTSPSSPDAGDESLFAQSVTTGGDESPYSPIAMTNGEDPASDPDETSFPSGAIFEVADFARIKDKPIADLAASTIAVFIASDFKANNKWRSTNKWIESIYGPSGKRGPIFNNVMRKIGKLPNGAQCGGVLVSPNTVVTNGHCLDTLELIPECTRVVSGFDTEAWRPRAIPAKRICYHRNKDLDYGLIKIDPRKHDVPPQKVEAISNLVDEIQPTFSISHPFGSSRVVAGNNDHTRIHHCTTSSATGDSAHSDGAADDESPVYSTLDSVKGSSGSPVYVPHPSEDRWVLFGLLSNNPKSNTTFRNGRYELRRAASPEDPCQGDVRRPQIMPLQEISSDIAKFAKDEELSNKHWKCLDPPHTECFIGDNGW